MSDLGSVSMLSLVSYISFQCSIRLTMVKIFF